MNMDESFTLEEFEQSEMEHVALIPNLDNVTVCSCKGVCLWDTGRNACPCKTINQYCSPACHGDNGKCMNNRTTLESDSSESDPLEEQVSFLTIIDANSLSIFKHNNKFEFQIRLVMPSVMRTTTYLKALKAMPKVLPKLAKNEREEGGGVADRVEEDNKEALAEGRLKVAVEELQEGEVEV